MMDNNKILQALRTIQHPNHGKDIIDSKMVHNLRIDDNKLTFDIKLRPQEDNLKMFLNTACTEAVQQMYPDSQVLINFIKESSNDFANPLPQIKNIIAVASGKGGVGKSTVSLNLALALKNAGAKVGLMDADLYGPSMPTMLGLKDVKPKIQPVQGKPKMIPIEKYGIHSISLGYLLEPEQAVVLRGPRLGGIIKQFVFDCVWPALDYLIIDLPPGTGDIQLTLVQTIPLTAAVMVTTPQDVAVADALKAMNMFLLPNVNVPILGVVENMSWFTPAELPNNKYYLFGQGGGEQLANLGDTKLLGQLPLVQSVREAGDKGLPFMESDVHPAKAYFDQMVIELKASLDKRNKEKGDTNIVTVS